MPFIKYDHGDLVSVAGTTSDKCACGQCGPYIVSLNGRKDDAIVRPNGGLIPSAVLSNVVDTYFNANALGISAFQLVQQEDPRVFEFLYEAKDNTPPDNAVFQLFSKELDRYLGERICVKFKRMDQIPAGKSYKRKKILSLAVH